MAILPVNCKTPGGASKLLATVNTGNIAKAQAKKEGHAMAESLDPYQTSAKQSTRKTKSLMPEESLEILQQAIINCQQSGVIASISPLYTNGQQCVIIVLANCNLINGNITLQS